MEILTSYNLIIEASAIIILSFIFSEVARKTNVPSVLMLITLGIWTHSDWGASTSFLFWNCWASSG